MQVNRSFNLVFPTPSPKPGALDATPGSTSVPDSKAEDSAGTGVSVSGAGVTYTPSGKAPTPKEAADLSSLSLEGQLELGKNKGLFTHITYSKEGVLMTKPPAGGSTESPEFVSSAVTTMREFAEGIAALKGDTKPDTATPASASKTSDFLASKLRNLQHVAAKLNVFA